MVSGDRAERLRRALARGVNGDAMTRWTFLTNHAQVLICVSRNSRMTAREIAETVGITERAVQRILDDLEEAAYLSRSRDGRKNIYEIHPDRPMRHPAQHGVAVRDLLSILATSES
jgi:DNA-binding MarR family transcriptional regulator